MPSPIGNYRAAGENWRIKPNIKGLRRILTVDFNYQLTVIPISPRRDWGAGESDLRVMTRFLQPSQENDNRHFLLTKYRCNSFCPNTPSLHGMTVLLTAKHTVLSLSDDTGRLPRF